MIDKKIRIKNGLTQKDFAKKTNISLRYLNNLEKGDRTPSMDMLEQIAAIFKLSVKDLIAD
ncbi:MAG: helix-turn-helix transcriptional regulator [Candidatus Margulisiibacteriota bacterium]